MKYECVEKFYAHGWASQYDHFIKLAENCVQFNPIKDAPRAQAKFLRRGRGLRKQFFHSHPN